MTAHQRIDPRAGLVRGVRAAALTVPTVGTAVAAHSLSDGCAGPVALATAAGLCWPAAVALLGTRRSLPTLLAWVVVAQLAVHVLLERMCPSVVSGQTSLVEHLSHTTGTTMLATHAVAAAVTALLLHRADGGLWVAHALRRAVARLLVPRHAVVVAPSLRPVPASAVPVVLRDLGETAPLQRRGPPAPCAPVLAA